MANKNFNTHGSRHENPRMLTYKNALFLAIALKEPAQRAVVIGEESYGAEQVIRLKSAIREYLGDIRKTISYERDSREREMRKLGSLAAGEEEKRRSFGHDRAEEGEDAVTDDELTDDDYENIKTGHMTSSSLTALMALRRLPEGIEVLDMKCAGLIAILEKKELNLCDAEKLVYDLSYITQESAQAALAEYSANPISDYPEAFEAVKRIVPAVNKRIGNELYTVCRRLCQKLGIGTIELMDGENRVNKSNPFRGLDPTDYRQLLQIYNRIANNTQMTCVSERDALILRHALENHIKNGGEFLPPPDAGEVNDALLRIEYVMGLKDGLGIRSRHMKDGTMPTMAEINLLEDRLERESERALTGDIENRLYRTQQVAGDLPGQEENRDRTVRFLSNYTLWQAMKDDFLSWTQFFSFDAMVRELEKDGRLTVKCGEQMPVFFNSAFLSGAKGLSVAAVVRDELALKCGYSLHAAISYLLAVCTFKAKALAIPESGYMDSGLKEKELMTVIRQRTEKIGITEEELKEDISAFFETHTSESVIGEIKKLMASSPSNSRQYLGAMLEMGRGGELRTQFTAVLKALVNGLDGNDPAFAEGFRELANRIADGEEGVRGYEAKAARSLLTFAGLHSDGSASTTLEQTEAERYLLGGLVSRQEKGMTEECADPRVLLGLLEGIAGCRDIIADAVREFDRRNNRRNLELVEKAFSAVRESYESLYAPIDNELLEAVFEDGEIPHKEGGSFNLAELYENAGRHYNEEQIKAVRTVLEQSAVYEGRELTEAESGALEAVLARMLEPVKARNLEIAEQEFAKTANTYVHRTLLDEQFERIDGGARSYTGINRIERSSGMYFTSGDMVGSLETLTGDTAYLNDTVTLLRDGAITAAEAVDSVSARLITINHPKLDECLPVAEAPMDAKVQFRLMKEATEAFRSADYAEFSRIMEDIGANNPLFDRALADRAYGTRDERLLLLQLFPCPVGMKTVAENRTLENDYFLDSGNRPVRQLIEASAEALSAVKASASAEAKRLSAGLDLLLGTEEERKAYASAVIAAASVVDRRNMVPVHVRGYDIDEGKKYRSPATLASASRIFNTLNLDNIRREEIRRTYEGLNEALKSRVSEGGRADALPSSLSWCTRCGINGVVPGDGGTHSQPLSGPSVYGEVANASALIGRYAASASPYRNNAGSMHADSRAPYHGDIVKPSRTSPADHLYNLSRQRYAPSSGGSKRRAMEDAIRRHPRMER